jgi:hypothetical protein
VAGFNFAAHPAAFAMAVNFRAEATSPPLSFGTFFFPYIRELEPPL